MLDDRLAVFKECLEGGALIWWQNLDQDVKEDWEETRQAFVEEYVGTIAYQLELEARWNDLEEQTAQNVAGLRETIISCYTKWKKKSKTFCRQ